MNKDRVYIIPTFYGFMYGVGALVCLLAGAIYTNNLAYLLCFFLIAIFVIGMHQSNNNLKKLKLVKINFDLLPADSTGSGLVLFKSDNPEGHARLELRATNKYDKLSGAIERIHGHSQTTLRFKIASGPRGVRKFDKLTVFSRYPFGLFYVWRTFRINESLYVYPMPKGHEPLPLAQLNNDSFIGSKKAKGDDFKGHKPYEAGESQRRIDWKAFARGRPLLTKEFDEGENSHIYLTTKVLQGDWEEKLQQLCRWIMECDQKSYSYVLDMDEARLSQGSGYSQKQKALKMLAESESQIA